MRLQRKSHGGPWHLSSKCVGSTQESAECSVIAPRRRHASNIAVASAWKTPFYGLSPPKGERPMIARRHFLAGVAPAMLLPGKSRTLDAQETPSIRFVLDWKYEGEHAQFTVPITDGTYRRLGLNVTLDRGNGSGDPPRKSGAGGP